MKSPDVIVMKSVASDRRYLAENLAILDPNQTRAGVRYRSVWLAPDLRKRPGTLRGRVGLVVFFDWETGLFEAVREVEISDVAENGEFVRLALGCGRFVRVSEPLTRDHIPRLSEEGFDEKVPAPADRKGRHAFVYAVPPEWKRQIESLTSREDAASWLELLRSLVAPKGSPYRSCRIVFLSSGEERKELSLTARTPVWRQPGQLPVRIHAIDGSQPASGTVPVRILGYVGQRMYWSTEVSVSPAKAGRVLVPRPDPDTAGGRPTVRLEAFPLGYGSATGSLATTDSVSALEMLLEVGGDPAVETSAPLESWTRALEHVDPASDGQRETCRQLLRGIRSHGVLETGLVDRLLDWQMPADAMALLRDRPELLRRAGHRQLATWLRRMTAAPIEARRDLARHAIGRIAAYVSADELLDGLISFLEAQATSEDFWACLPLHELWLTAECRVDNVPLVQALLNADDPRERFGKLLERHAHSSKRHEARSIVQFASAFLGNERGQELALQFLRDGRPGLEWSQLVEGAGPALIRELLGEVEFDARAYKALSDWYSRHVEGAARRVPGLRADLALWLLEAAEKISTADTAKWLEEVARIAIEEKDWALLLALGQRLPELPAGWRSAVEDALESEGQTPLSDLEERLLSRLKGRRLLLLGCQTPPPFVSKLKTSFQVTVVCKTKGKDSEFDQKDIPTEVDYCIVLKWAGHNASACARSRLGPDRVVFVGRPGFRTLSHELKRWARTLPDPDEK
ncbi:MAG TPA: hypothetical protein PLL76_16210 [Thermoanaerobaculia bacterium]|nr:hypothetical protein [Thermoanaerobaculia bacterium]HQP87794.1 hypothetical protein [Thermoanaerobaculia bacterium]